VPSFTWTDAELGTYTDIVIGALGDAPTYTKPTTDVSYTNAITYIDTDNDVELANASLSMQSVKLNQFQADIQNELNKFNQELALYNDGITIAIKNTELAQQKMLQQAKDTTDLNLQNKIYGFNAQVEQYKELLQRYSIQMGAYGTETNRALGLYSANIQKYAQVLQGYLQMIAVLKAEYDASMK
jgi:hypothetical protein